MRRDSREREAEYEKALEQLPKTRHDLLKWATDCFSDPALMGPVPIFRTWFRGSVEEWLQGAALIKASGFDVEMTHGNNGIRVSRRLPAELRATSDPVVVIGDYVAGAKTTTTIVDSHVGSAATAPGSSAINRSGRGF